MMIDVPRFMSIRELAATGIMPEHALRLLVKQKRIPHILIGKKALINVEEATKALKTMCESHGGTTDD